MNIESIDIKNVQGGKNFKIDLNLKDRVSIIHGPNGCGKTTILKIINYLFNLNFFGLSIIDFESIKVTYADQSFLEVKSIEEINKPTPNESGSESPSLKYVKIVLSNSDNQSATYSNYADSKRLCEQLIYNLGNFSISDSSTFIDNDTQIIYSPLDFIKHFNNHFIVRDFIKRKSHLTSDFTFKNKIKVDSIDTQRLLIDAEDTDSTSYVPQPKGQRNMLIRSRSVPTTESSVNVLARKLKKQLGSALAAYANEAQTIDQAFTEKYFIKKKELSGNDSPPKLYLEETMSNFINMIDHQKELAQLGIINEYSLQILPVNDQIDKKEDFIVLSIYIEGMLKKQEKFGDLFEKSSRFLFALNSLFKDKVVTMSHTDGIEVKLKNNNSIKLPLTSLSSGEQHLLVLFYELTFSLKTNDPKLFIIDEPEISLHTSWQRILIDLLIQSTDANCYFLIATHSPQIVGNRTENLTARIKDEDEDDDEDDEDEDEEDSE